MPFLLKKCSNFQHAVFLFCRWTVSAVSKEVFSQKILQFSCKLFCNTYLHTSWPSEAAPFGFQGVRGILVTISCSSGMGAASHPLSHLFLMFCLLVGGRVLLSDHEVDLFKSIYFFLFSVSGSQATKCKYDCEQTGGCTAKYFGPPRPGNTIVSLPKFVSNL